MSASGSDAALETISHRVTTGLLKIGLASKSRAWQEGSAQGLTPTQGQILALLHLQQGMRLSEVATALAVRPATASDAVQSLVHKGLVQKTRAPEDARAVRLTLTAAGQREAERVAAWSDFLLAAVDTLTPAEQAALLRGLVKMIRTLQIRGQIPVSRMCVTCHFFRPYVYLDPLRPHHCAFVEASFGDEQLRLDCPDHQAASAAEAQRLWEAFVHGSEGAGTEENRG